MINNTCAFSVLLAVICLPRLASPQGVRHIERALGWSRSPVSDAALDGRLAQAALQYRSYAPIPRFALYDLAYPKDSAEAAQLGSNAVLVVIAVVQDSAELPFTRLYMSTESGTEDLLPVASIASHVTDSVVANTLGRFRLDALYLLPLSLRATPGELLADFAIHRRGFRLTAFSGEVPGPVAQLGRLPGHSTFPPSSVLWAFVRREYPDLASVLAPN